MVTCFPNLTITSSEKQMKNIVSNGAEMLPLTNKVRDKIRAVGLELMRRCVQHIRENGGNFIIGNV